MARKKMTQKDAEDFKKPVAKNKADRKLGDEYLKKVGETRQPNTGYVDPKAVGGASLRGVMEETMARVYEEMWPSMTTRDGIDNVDIEIREEAYILGLTMICGNDDFKPRKGLKIRDHHQKLPGYCKEHKEAA